MEYMFSKRVNYTTEENKISKLLKEKKSSGVTVLDLMESNPTNARFAYDEDGILNSISKPDSLKYAPLPKGLKQAREAVAGYYKEKNIEINPENIFLTSGTSEAYSFIFKLITNPDDEVLVPAPGYPLFTFIGEMELVKVKNYEFKYVEDEGWTINFESLESGITDKTRVIILLNPSNPTGNFIKTKEINKILRICRERKIAIICDEVFLDYPIEIKSENTFSISGVNYVLTFTLSGLSKICGLPQMKLSWIIIGGPVKQRQEALEKLEIITDTYLSVGTPIQLALNNLLSNKEIIQGQIRERILKNFNFLKSEIEKSKQIILLKTEGGWYSILKLNSEINEEDFVYELLNKKDVYINPGYFYDFNDEGYIILSLLTPVDVFENGVKRIIEFLNNIKYFKL